MKEKIRKISNNIGEFSHIYKIIKKIENNILDKFKKVILQIFQQEKELFV